MHALYGRLEIRFLKDLNRLKGGTTNATQHKLFIITCLNRFDLFIFLPTFLSDTNQDKIKRYKRIYCTENK